MTSARIPDLLAGAPGIAVESDGLDRYQVDGRTPAVAVTPTGIDNLQHVIRLCAEHRLAVIPWGAGTAMQSGNVPQRYDVALDMTSLNDVIEYEPADLTVGVQAGIRLQDLQKRLGEKGQFLPLDPPDSDAATIGGILATRSSGPLRYAYGAPRDLMIGIGIVQADGELIHAGGRVVKNVTGYDLGKLHIGAMGTLGVIVEARFKVLPLPPSDTTRVYVTKGSGDAIRLSFVLDRLNLGLKSLTTVNASAAKSLSLDGPAVAARITGEDAAVTAIAARVDTAATDVGVPPVAPAMSQASVWETIRGLQALETEEQSVQIRASMLPTQVAEFVDAIEAISPEHPPLISAIPLLGSVTARWADKSMDSATLVNSVFALARAQKLSAWIEAAPVDVKSGIDVWGPTPESFPLMRRLKEHYDAASMLNPGRYVGRL